jgi:hypothetical protein
VEVKANFQDGRRFYLRNSSACYKRGNYHPISMKVVTQTKTDMLSLKFRRAEVLANFQDGRCRHLGNSSECYKIGIYGHFYEIWYTDQERHAEFNNHTSGSVR